ncbi:MAG: hypothetical protein ACYDAN_01485 [Candidatus Limnocylindrales bacterium]
MNGNDERLSAWLPDAVMTRVEAEPVPTASRAFVAALCRRAPIDAFTALATAWRLATLRTRPVPLVTRVRAAALALGVGGVLATSSAVALAGVANVARQVVSQPSRAPQLEPARPTESPAGSLAPAPSAPPVLIVTPVDGDGLERPHPLPDATATPTPTPNRTARPTTRPDQGVDGSGGGSGGSTPRPIATPGGHDGSGDDGSGTRATPTPAPSSSPAPQPGDSAPDGGSSSGDSASSGD